MPLKTFWHVAKKTQLWKDICIQNPEATEKKLEMLYSKADHAKWIENEGRTDCHSVVLAAREEGS